MHACRSITLDLLVKGCRFLGIAGPRVSFWSGKWLFFVTPGGQHKRLCANNRRQKVLRTTLMVLGTNLMVLGTT